MKNIFLILFFLGFGCSAMAQQTNKYCNSQFGFCVDVPVTLKRVGASKAGDGQFFSAKDGSTLSVYGTFNTTGETLKQRFEGEQTSLTNDSTLTNTTQLPTIEKAEMLENSYTISYFNKAFTNVIYRKLENNAWKSIELQYPTAKAKEYNEKVKRLIGSLK